MANDEHGNNSKVDKIDTIKDLFEHPYFQLAIEKEVRARVGAYAKIFVAVSTIALAVVGSITGIKVSSLLEDAKGKYEKEAKDLEAKAEELKKGVDNVNRETHDDERTAIEVLRKSGEAEARADMSANKADGLVRNINAELSQASEANRAAAEALTQAKQANEKAGSAKEEAERSAREAKTDANRIKETKEFVDQNSKLLDPLVNSETKMLFTSEVKRVLVQGHGVKNPCVELENSVHWDRIENKFEPGERGANAVSNKRGVRFRIVHIHFQSLKLGLEVFPDCSSLNEGSEYIYDLKDKFDYERWHPLRGTPFTFRLADVFYPTLGSTFIDVEMRPDQELLKCQDRAPDITDEHACPILKDETRHAQVFQPGAKP